MAVPSVLQIEVLTILSTQGALQIPDILTRSEILDDRIQVANALQRLRTTGLVERANNQCWRVTDAGRSEARSAAKHAAAIPAAAPCAPRQDPAPSDTTITTEDLEQLEQRATPTRAARPPQQRAPRPQDEVRSPAIIALQRAAQQAQTALDAYVWEIGDAAVLEPLMKARDAANQALAAYEASA